MSKPCPYCREKVLVGNPRHSSICPLLGQPEMEDFKPRREMMSEEKHTPGPWEVIGWKLEGFDMSVINPKGEAELGNWLVAGVRWKANARLIAAAPDLLAACKEARRKIAELIPFPSPSIPKTLAEAIEAVGDDADRVIALINAAISKAEA